MVEKKEVPIHSMSWGYYTGGMTMFFFGIQVLTGLFLLFYYQPTVSDANISVEYINKYVTCGALIRNMHAWSSSGMILFAMVHLLTAFAMKSFVKASRSPGLPVYSSYLLPLLLALPAIFCPGIKLQSTLPKSAYNQLNMSVNISPGSYAEVPRILRETFQGESSVGQSCSVASMRYCMLVILPLLLVGLLGLHLLSVQLHGMSQGVDQAAKKSEKFVSIFVFKDLTLWSSAFLVLFIMASCIPFESFLSYPLLAPFNALGSTPGGIKLRWCFFFVYYPLELLPFWVILLASVVLVAILMAAPWIFRGHSKTLQLLAGLASIYLIVMTVFGEQIYEFYKH